MRRTARSVTWHRSINKLIFRRKWFFIFSFFFFLFKAAILGKATFHLFREKLVTKESFPYWRKRGKLPRRPRAPAPRLFTGRTLEGKRGFEIACVHRRQSPSSLSSATEPFSNWGDKRGATVVDCLFLANHTLFTPGWNAGLVIIYVAKKEVTNEGKVRNRG